LEEDQTRFLIAQQYLNACQWICAGLRQQHQSNKFHFVITLRSFIEYTRRGIWFLCWANRENLKRAYDLTFDKPGSPNLLKMDEMINNALGKGKVSPLKTELAGINEPFIDCLHALTHGNPISARIITFGVEKIFDTGMLLMRAETDLGMFRILLYRKMLGERQRDIWKMLRTIHDRPADVATNVKIAAHLLKKSGKADGVFIPKN
jgi:hypothetical protein